MASALNGSYENIISALGITIQGTATPIEALQGIEPVVMDIRLGMMW